MLQLPEFNRDKLLSRPVEWTGGGGLVSRVRTKNDDRRG